MNPALKLNLQLFCLRTKDYLRPLSVISYNNMASRLSSIPTQQLDDSIKVLSKDAIDYRKQD